MIFLHNALLTLGILSFAWTAGAIYTAIESSKAITLSNDHKLEKIIIILVMSLFMMFGGWLPIAILTTLEEVNQK